MAKKKKQPAPPLITTEGFEGGQLWGPGGRPPTGGRDIVTPQAAPSLGALYPSLAGRGGTLSLGARQPTGGGPNYQRSIIGSDIGGGIGGAIGGIFNLIQGTEAGGAEFRQDALRAFQALQIPDFDFSDLTPPQLRLVGLMSPEVYEAQVPQEVKLIMDSPQARSQMEEALRGLGEISREGLPELDRLAAEEAANQIRGALQSGEEAFITNLRRRGRLGAGAETQARSVAARGAAELGSQLGRGLQQETLQRRLQGLRDYGSAAGMLRAQDVGVQQSQADAMNRFQEIAAAQRQQAAQYGAGARERTQAYNVGTQQRLAEGQELSNYETQLENIRRQNELKQAQFGAEQFKAAGIAQQYGGLAQQADAKRAAEERNIQLIGGGIGGAIGGIGGLL